jgi:hypothetical protein
MCDCSAFPEWENKMGHVGLPYQESVQGTADTSLSIRVNLAKYLIQQNCGKASMAYNKVFIVAETIGTISFLMLHIPK